MRITAWSASLAVHLLLAALLWLPPSEGGGARVQDERPLVITLLPLDGDATASMKRTDIQKPAPAPSSRSPGATPPIQNAAAPAGPVGRSEFAAGPAPSTEMAVSAPSGLDSQTYQRALLVHIARYRRYPDLARRDHLEGVVVLRFLMDRTGNVLDAWVDRTSGVTMLDAEAVAAVKRAQPLPVIPASLPDRLGIALPIAFSLQ